LASETDLTQRMTTAGIEAVYGHSHGRQPAIFYWKSIGKNLQKKVEEKITSN